MTSFVILRWWVWLAAAAFGALAGYAGANLLALRRPNGERRKRLLGAALIAPSLIVIGAASGVLAIFVTAEPGDWSDLAMAALLQIGALLAVIAGLAGLAAALLAERVRAS